MYRQEGKPTFHSGLVISVFHRTAICCSFFLGFPLEHARHGAEDVQVEAGLYNARGQSVFEGV
jgi:hypothetical protein